METSRPERSVRSLRTKGWIRPLSALLLFGLTSFSSGCTTTPQSRLHGRWFNSAMSIRFRTDGTVIFNSERGLATGRYFFDGEVRPEASEQPVPNLTMDLQSGGEVYRVIYELQFLGSNRVRLSAAGPDEQPSDDTVRPVVILKRAENEDVNGVASAG